MRAQADPGKTSAALAQFEKCRTILKTQLGVEPDAETRSLAALIRASRLRNPAAPEPGFQRFPSDRAITVFRAGQGPSARLQDLARGSAPDALQAALDAARAERTPQSPAIRVMTNGWPRPPLADMGPGFLVVPEVYRLFENWSPF